MWLNRRLPVRPDPKAVGSLCQEHSHTVLENNCLSWFTQSWATRARSELHPTYGVSPELQVTGAEPVQAFLAVILQPGPMTTEPELWEQDVPFNRRAWKTSFVQQIALEFGTPQFLQLWSSQQAPTTTLDLVLLSSSLHPGAKNILQPCRLWWRVGRVSAGRAHTEKPLVLERFIAQYRQPEDRRGNPSYYPVASDYPAVAPCLWFLRIICGFIFNLGTVLYCAFFFLRLWIEANEEKHAQAL